MLYPLLRSWGSRIPVLRALWATAVTVRWLALSAFSLIRSALSEGRRMYRRLTPLTYAEAASDKNALRIWRKRFKRWRRGERTFNSLISCTLGQLPEDRYEKARRLYLAALTELVERGERVSASRRKALVDSLNARPSVWRKLGKIAKEASANVVRYVAPVPTTEVAHAA